MSEEIPVANDERRGERVGDERPIPRFSSGVSPAPFSEDLPGKSAVLLSAHWGWPYPFLLPNDLRGPFSHRCLGSSGDASCVSASNAGVMAERSDPQAGVQRGGSTLDRGWAGLCV